jgi:hypothetical protein
MFIHCHQRSQIEGPMLPIRPHRFYAALLVSLFIPFNLFFLQGQTVSPAIRVQVQRKLCLSICWVISLTTRYINEALYSVWSLSHFLTDTTFFLTVIIFTSPGPDGNASDLDANHVLRFLREKYPFVPILVKEFDESIVPHAKRIRFPASFPIVVAGRPALPFTLSSDLILTLDTDTLVLENPFPALSRELKSHPNALLMGVQDDAAKGKDHVFTNRIETFNPRWDVYQQAALYFMRNGPSLRNELEEMFRKWSLESRVLDFPEQDAIGIWFDPSKKGIMGDELLRQWADCYNKNDMKVRLICHARRGMENAWATIAKEIIDAGIQIKKREKCDEEPCWLVFRRLSKEPLDSAA